MARRKVEAPKARWADKIVGAGYARADQLLANESNWRIHPKLQQEAISGVLEQVGWVQQVVVNKRTSAEWGADQYVETVVDGHLRVQMAISANEQVPVLYVDLTPNEERLVLATLDPISAMATTDSDQLQALLSEIQSDNSRVNTLLDQMRKDATPVTSRERGTVPTEELDLFLNATIKQIVLFFKADEFDRVVLEMEKLRNEFGVESNTDVVLRLMNEHGPARP